MTGPRLQGLLYTRGDAASQIVTRTIDSPARLGVRCSLPLWLQRLEITDLKRNFRTSYAAYEFDLGRRIGLRDTWGTQIVSGWVFEVVPDGRHVHYIASLAKRFYDQYETTNPAASTTHWTAYLQTMVTAHVPALSTDYTNVDDSGTDIGANYIVDATTGTRPGNVIKEIIEFGSSANVTWDVYAREIPLALLQAKKPVLYAKPRSDTDSIDWQVNRSDLVELSQSRHIWDLENDTTHYYGGGKTATTAAADTDSKAKYWTREQKRVREKMVQTPAEQFRDERQGVFSEAVQQASFTIGNKWVRGGTTGANWPLWYMLRAPGYIRVSDLDPEISLFDKSRDRKNVFYTAALDYDGETKTMTVTPDQPSTRLDAVLAREANISEAKGEIVGRKMKSRVSFAMPGMLIARD